MKIVFFLDNQAIANVDVRSIEKGNPGIGGTEYMILMVASMLSERSNNLAIELLMTQEQLVPQQLKSKVVGSLTDAIKKAEADGCNFFVLKVYIKRN